MEFAGEGLETVSFDAFDRCDRCGHQALALARKPGFSDLLFCAHHHRDHEDALITSGWAVVFDHSTYEGYKQPVTA